MGPRTRIRRDKKQKITKRYRRLKNVGTQHGTSFEETRDIEKKNINITNTRALIKAIIIIIKNDRSKIQHC